MSKRPKEEHHSLAFSGSSVMKKDFSLRCPSSFPNEKDLGTVCEYFEEDCGWCASTAFFFHCRGRKGDAVLKCWSHVVRI